MEYDNKPFQTPFAFHLAGIIPIAGQSLDHKLDFPDCMMPISQDYTLIEHLFMSVLWQAVRPFGLFVMMISLQ